MADDSVQHELVQQDLASTQPRNACKTEVSSSVFEIGSDPLTKPIVSELMSAKHKPASADPHLQLKTLNAQLGRDGLGAYIASPESFPSPSCVLSYDDAFVSINDAYPKSSIHLLLLPRDLKTTKLHPFIALEDPQFLGLVRKKAAEVHSLVASELRRRHRNTSASEQSRNHAMSLDPPLETLPDGRDWTKEVMIGVHAHPSMNNLHIHILSVDRVSQSMKHKKHYNSFATEFFVPLKDFPLMKSDPRRHPGKEGYLQRDLLCWRCQKNFGNRFSQLKIHLYEEYEAWRRV